MTMNVEAEIRDLKRRVSEIEGPLGFLIQQVRSVYKDLLAFQAKVEQRFEKVDGRFERIEGRLDRSDGPLDRIEKGVRGLRDNMPGNCRRRDADRAAGARRQAAKTNMSVEPNHSPALVCPSHIQHLVAGEFGALRDEGEAGFGLVAHQPLDRACGVGAVLGEVAGRAGACASRLMVVSLSWPASFRPGP